MPDVVPASSFYANATVPKRDGRFLGKDVVVHQYAKVYRVDFSPIEDSGTLVLR